MRVALCTLPSFSCGKKPLHEKRTVTGLALVTQQGQAPCNPTATHANKKTFARCDGRQPQSIETREGEQMAIGMLKLRNGSKGKGIAHFNYIMREDKYKPHAEKKECKLEKFENSGHGNMPQWAKDNPKLFWQEADKHERQNGRIYKEHIIALPRELNEDQRHELVKDWIKQEIGDKHPYSYAIHCPKAMDGNDQPHVHFMFSERTHDGIERSPDQFFKRYNAKSPEKGGAEKANKAMTKTQSKEKTKEQRMRLGDHINKHLERAGSKERIDMRNWKERGVEKPQNISYTQMQDPAVKQAYKLKLTTKIELAELKKQLDNAIVETNNKAELHQKQLETLNSFKAEPTQENINQAQGFTNEKLNELKAEAEQSKGEIEQLAQRQELNQTHLKKYIMAKRTLNTIEQVAKERAEQKDQQEHETPTNPPPPTEQKSRKGQWVRHRQELKKEQGEAVTTSPPAHPAEKVADMPLPKPQEQTAGAEKVGQGLSEKDESNIKGIREIVKATFANDPAKLKIALERLDKQAEAVSRGEIKLSDQSFVTKETPKFDYERPAEQVQDKGKGI